MNDKKKCLSMILRNVLFWAILGLGIIFHHLKNLKTNTFHTLIRAMKKVPESCTI